MVPLDKVELVGTRAELVELEHVRIVITVFLRQKDHNLVIPDLSDLVVNTEQVSFTSFCSSHQAHAVRCRVQDPNFVRAVVFPLPTESFFS